MATLRFHKVTEVALLWCLVLLSKKMFTTCAEPSTKYFEVYKRIITAAAAVHCCALLACMLGNVGGVVCEQSSYTKVLVAQLCAYGTSSKGNAAQLRSSMIFAKERLRGVYTRFAPRCGKTKAAVVSGVRARLIATS